MGGFGFSFFTYTSFVLSVGIVDDFKTWLLTKFQALVNFFRDIAFDVFKAFTEFLKALVMTFLDMLKDLFFFFFDTLLNLMTTLLNALGSLFSALNFSSLMSGMPSEVLNIVGLIGLGQCMGFIVTALIIRMTLQLIPFTRLGS